MAYIERLQELLRGAGLDIIIPKEDFHHLVELLNRYDIPALRNEAYSQNESEEKTGGMSASRMKFTRDASPFITKHFGQAQPRELNDKERKFSEMSQEEKKNAKAQRKVERDRQAKARIDAEVRQQEKLGKKDSRGLDRIPYTIPKEELIGRLRGQSAKDLVSFYRKDKRSLDKIAKDLNIGIVRSVDGEMVNTLEGVAKNIEEGLPRLLKPLPKRKKRPQQ